MKTGLIVLLFYSWELDSRLLLLSYLELREGTLWLSVLGGLIIISKRWFWFEDAMFINGDYLIFEWTGFFLCMILLMYCAWILNAYFSVEEFLSEAFGVIKLKFLSDERALYGLGLNKTYRWWFNFVSLGDLLNKAMSLGLRNFGLCFLFSMIHALNRSVVCL